MSKLHNCLFLINKISKQWLYFPIQAYQLLASYATTFVELTNYQLKERRPT